MTRDYLVAHGKADASAAVLGAALVELLLDVRQLALRYAAAIVADADMYARGVGSERDVDLLAVPAVLRGVVEQVQEHLLQPLRVAGNQRDLGGGLSVVHLNTGLTHQLAVGEYRVLKLGGDVDKLDAEIEAPVLYAGEFQHLRHHARKPLGLLGDDVYPAQRVALHGLVESYRLRPAGYRGERGAKLVRHLRDELRARFLRHGYLFRHAVQLVGQAAKLVFAGLFNSDSVAAGGDVARGLGEILDRLGHKAREPEVHADEENTHQNDDDYRGRIHRAGDEPYREQQQDYCRHAGGKQLSFQVFKHSEYFRFAVMNF